MQASTPNCSEYSFAACRYVTGFGIIGIRNKKKAIRERLQEPEWDYLHNNLKISLQIDKQKVLHAL
jgi:hypothetical protein